MGLDGVELIMAFEEKFGINLPDEETVKMHTPKTVGDYIFSKLQQTDEKTCQSQRAFYLLRKAGMNLFRRRRNAIKLNTPLKELVSEKDATLAWKNLKGAIQARSWPHLVRPVWLNTTFLFFPPVFFALTWLWLSPILSELTWMVVVPLTIILIYLEKRLTVKFMTRIPKSTNTVRDLVPYAITSEQIKWARPQVSDLVKEIVLEQLDLSEADYREDADFADDFGLDR